MLVITEFLFQFISDVLSTKKLATVHPPTQDEYRKQIILSPGQIISMRSFKQSSSRRYRKIMENEFRDALAYLSENKYGRIINYTNLGTHMQIMLFKKSKPMDIENHHLCTKQEYEKKFHMKNAKCINENMVEYVEHH